MRKIYTSMFNPGNLWFIITYAKQ